MHDILCILTIGIGHYPLHVHFCPAFFVHFKFVMRVCLLFLSISKLLGLPKD